MNIIPLEALRSFAQDSTVIKIFTVGHDPFEDFF